MVTPSGSPQHNILKDSLKKFKSIRIALASLSLISALGGIMLSNDVLADTKIESVDTSQPHIRVEMIAEKTQLSPGESALIGIHFIPDENWHIYWQNPGDTGLAPTIDWKLPEGFNISELQWPHPHSIPVAHLINYGYHGAAVIYATINAPENHNPKQSVSIGADLSWLVCEEACVPGDSSLTLALGANNTTINPSVSQAHFSKAIQNTPKVKNTLGNTVTVDKTQNLLELDIYAQELIFKDAEHVEVFIKNLDLVQYADPVKIQWKKNRLRWQQKLSEYYSSTPKEIDIIVVVDHKKSYEFSLTNS